MCSNSPIACVPVEFKAKRRGKWEQQQQRTSLDQLCIQHKWTVMGEMNDNLMPLPVLPLQEFPLYKVRRLGLGEPQQVSHSLGVGGGLVNVCNHNMYIVWFIMITQYTFTFIIYIWVHYNQKYPLSISLLLGQIWNTCFCWWAKVLPLQKCVIWDWLFNYQVC